MTFAPASVALSSLWLFWVAPIVGGVIGGLIGRGLQQEWAYLRARADGVLGPERPQKLSASN
jgi:hypothetical protein